MRPLLFLPIPWTFKWDYNGKRNNHLYLLLITYLQLVSRFLNDLFISPFNSMSGSQNMGSQYLEIFQAKRSDYYAAIASVSPSCHLFFF